MRRPADVRRAALSLLLAAAALSAGCSRQQPVAVPVELFLANHWAEPIPPQGPPPNGFSVLEASLSPQACGQCHAQQYEAWRTSLHSRTVGPGLLWQLALMDQAQANRCFRCHAPLAEQKALLAIEHGWLGAPPLPPPGYIDPDLGHQGLVCAACHVRNHRRFGPPARPDAEPGTAHGGFTSSAAFQDSRFCAHCHQFPPDGPSVEGKLFEDTLNQWAASPMAPQRTCQSCHMPDRQHSWRGIHDAETTRSALDLGLDVVALGEGRFEARARVRNVGAGHHFPTYMVPKVELDFLRRDADGSTHALGRQVIGWTVDTQLTREIADTRIPAGEAREFPVPFAAPRAAGWKVELVVRVKPGEHYERMFREHLARDAQLPPQAVSQLRQALADVLSAEYELTRVVAAPPIAN
ncbi:MAG: multiheme c-type cytochrome [Burkholderiales bacterium]|nr:multiheme c-type cytochrome [Burkholderiales bacterium]